MRIEELQIGNFVMLEDNIYKIDEISANGWIFISEIKTNMGLTTTDDIINRVKPIPLTTAIFEKNGFKKVDYDYLKPNVAFDSKDMLIRITDLTNSGDGYWYVHIDNEDYSTIGSCDVKYVHQFQNLLTLCGYEMDVIV